MNKFSVKRVSQKTGLSVSRIYKICERAEIGRFDLDLGLFILNDKEIEFIESRKGQRGKKL